VRTDGPILDPAWTIEQVSLEDLVLAYMGQGKSQLSGYVNETGDPR
jgi:ABC-2 type transport system ATP-binding protein